MHDYELSENGYILLKRVLSDAQVHDGLKCDNGDGTVNYKSMKSFIDREFMPTLQKNIPMIKHTNYVKFRYSNNNNSIDAATFHSDIYNHTDNEIMPIYTTLCYFDRTNLEVIPGSHKKSFHQTATVAAYYKKQVITVEPGDILIFHANLYHRGVGYHLEQNRRVLQIFDVFPDNTIESQYYNDVVTVVSSKSTIQKHVASLSQFICKYPTIIDSINFFHYMLVHNDLQYKVAMSDIPPYMKTNKFITYESGEHLYYEDIPNFTYRNNVNIVCRDRTETDTSNYYLYYAMFYIILLSLVLTIVYIYSSKAKTYVYANILAKRRVGKKYR